MFKLSLPLVCRQNSVTFLGNLFLEKNIKHKAIKHYTMRLIAKVGFVNPSFLTIVKCFLIEIIV